MKNNKGSILVSLIIILPALMFITATLLELTVNSFRLAQADKSYTQAQLAADAGLDYAIAYLNENETLSSTTEETLFTDPVTGNVSTYELDATLVGEDYIITSTGRSYRNASAAEPTKTVVIKVYAKEIISGNNSVVTGFGGLILNNTSSILGGGGLYINGFIQMNGNGQIGESTDPVDLFVANQRCPVPADATYPRVCNPGENPEPIEMNHNQAYIYGDVRANDQSTHPRIISNGVIASSGVSAEPMPPHDRNAQKAAIAHNSTGNRNCSNETWTIEANTKVNGNVNIGNKCDIVIKGDLWITGNLTSSANNKTVTVHDTTLTAPNIMVDGSAGINLEKVDFFENISGVGLTVIAYWCSDFSINDCSDVTGTTLSNSGLNERIRLESGVNADSVFFYARWSKASIRNTALVGAVAGQTVELDNSTGITSATTVGTATRAWVVSDYQRNF